MCYAVCHVSMSISYSQCSGKGCPVPYGLRVHGHFDTGGVFQEEHITYTQVFAW